MDQTIEGADSWPTGIFASSLFVEDLQTAKQFYPRVFGLPIQEDDNSAGFKPVSHLSSSSRRIPPLPLTTVALVRQNKHRQILYVRGEPGWVTKQTLKDSKAKI
jgi:catechol 2,3-dioxygenase-like lactoylglutathione lyase family enzyme